MSIHRQLNELYSIQMELKLLQNKITQFKTRKSELEDTIIKYLNSVNQESIQYKNLTIYKDKINRTGRKKKQDKHNDIKRILYQEGVRNPSKVLNDIMDAQKGKKVETSKLSYSGAGFKKK